MSIGEDIVVAISDFLIFLSVVEWGMYAIHQRKDIFLVLNTL